MPEFDPYLFMAYPAISSTNSVPLRNAVGQVYAPDDEDALFPLPITQWDGTNLSALVSSPQGIYPAFRCEGHTAVVVKSGEFKTEIQSKYGVLLEVGITPDRIAEAISAAAIAAEAAVRAESAAASVPIGAGGREVQMRTSATHIQWRYVGDTAWNDLVTLASLAGAPGTVPELRTSATHVQWRQAGASTWTDLVPLSELAGTAGQSPQMRVSGGFLQTKLPTESTWLNLFDLSGLSAGGGDGWWYEVLWNGTAWVNSDPPAGTRFRLFNAKGQTSATAYDGPTVAGVSDLYLIPYSTAA